MKTRALLLSLLLASGTALLAQEQTTAPAEQPTLRHAGRNTPLALREELKLTDEQVKLLQEIDARHSDAMKELNRTVSDQEAKRKRTIEMRDKKQAEIKAVLTKDQNAQYERIKQEQRDANMKARTNMQQKPHNE
ncbi:MAG: hypothetical protein H6591_13435 [Flavobacteriales bacterium]|nr:hypothetical protein [Flavobacteriales bacterium]